MSYFYTCTYQGLNKIVMPKPKKKNPLTGKEYFAKDILPKSRTTCRSLFGEQTRQFTFRHQEQYKSNEPQNPVLIYAGRRIMKNFRFYKIISIEPDFAE